jgi:hypothetical protein
MYGPQPAGQLRISGDYSWLDNENPDPQVNWDFVSHVGSAIVEWFPKEARRYSILAEYTRSSVVSRINFIVPNLFLTQRTAFREDANSGTFLLRIGPRGYTAYQPGLNVGGTVYASTGSRPMRYYQPMARLSVPMKRNTTVNAEWRWYSLAERGFAFENFASHQLMISLTLVQ